MEALISILHFLSTNTVWRVIFVGANFRTNDPILNICSSDSEVESKIIYFRMMHFNMKYTKITCYTVIKKGGGSAMRSEFTKLMLLCSSF